MDAILATIVVDGRRAIVVIYREGVEIDYFLLYFMGKTSEYPRLELFTWKIPRFSDSVLIPT
jgi:hypothetical protein